MLHKFFTLSLAVGASLFLTACAGASHDPSDPMEGFNRGVFKFNDAVDTAVLAPVAKGYRAAVPQPARTGVRNFVKNLKSPTVIANEILQGDVKGAANATTRMLANTLIGVGGIFDVASGIEASDEDFGQTLGKYGVGSGPYVVLPFFGPSNARDTVGLAVDSFTDPLNMWLNNTDRDGWLIARVGVATVDKREELLDVLADLKKNSVDYYAAMRSAYGQRRDAQIRDNKTDDSALPDIQ